MVQGQDGQKVVGHRCQLDTREFRKVQLFIFGKLSCRIYILYMHIIYVVCSYIFFSRAQQFYQYKMLLISDRGIAKIHRYHQKSNCMVALEEMSSSSRGGLNFLSTASHADWVCV